MSNILHKVKDVVTGHHHGKESKDSNKRQPGASSGTGPSESSPSAGKYNPNEYASGTGGAGRQVPTEYGSQPAAGQYGTGTGTGTGDYGRPEGGSAPGGSSYSTQPGSGQYTEGTRRYEDYSKLGSLPESDPRHATGGTQQQQQQRSQW
ncbi:hypothetical protein P170DRAFT_478664 [Aspergillus steynii IBT 23096]|uniref:Uncharacterized protein n=1 Tax=Aspergillus steynii IBT 23096 TaxID=1392250 RepID=A0A2I2FYL8_9EURO|nr:uncharacterized protein P170DRAFT_478664 [Aspergillus steynii IBT 23096]PLB45725.1 hypothetical protein P170DRAFT_478664 [Aspergillus steynii IBT 23096]